MVLRWLDNLLVLKYTTNDLGESCPDTGLIGVV